MSPWLETVEVWQISRSSVWASSLHSGVPPWREMLPSLIYVSRWAAKFLLLQQLSTHSLFQKHVCQFPDLPSQTEEICHCGTLEGGNLTDTIKTCLAQNNKDRVTILRWTVVISFWVRMLWRGFRCLWAGILLTADYSEHDWVVVIAVTDLMSVCDGCIIVLRHIAALLCGAVH